MKWIKIPEKEIEITEEQQYNGLTYPKILEEVKEKKIASYNLLQWLRNSKKYREYFEHFWVFVPNPDNISKDNGYVAGFYVFSGWAYLNCGRDPDISDGALGVFLIRSLK